MEGALSDKVRTFVNFRIQSHVRAEGYRSKGTPGPQKRLLASALRWLKRRVYQLAISMLSLVISSNTFTGRSNA